MDAFPMQMATLVIAPTFFTAGLYVLLGSLIHAVGPESSFLRPRSYLWIFCTCDVISLVVQAIGGGTAATQASKVNGDTKLGTYIMVAGIVFQMASITAFVVCGLESLRRSRRPHLRRRLKTRMRCLIMETVFSVVIMYIRSIYRTIELLEGWKGYLITTE